MFVEKKYNRPFIYNFPSDFGGQSQHMWIVVNIKQTVNQSADTLLSVYIFIKYILYA